MVIDRFSLALEPWTGIGFGLAALLPPNNKKVPPEGDTNSNCLVINSSGLACGFITLILITTCVILT